MRYRPALRFSVPVAALVALVGCTQVQRSFPERSDAEVWTAVSAVATEPRYDDWFVIENHVLADRETRTVDIYRELRRDLALPNTRIQREDRTYRFRVRLEDGPPTEVTFTSRGWAVPAHAHAEGLRFLDEVDELLAGMPAGATTGGVPTSTPAAPATPPPPPPPPPPASSPQPPPSAPPVDIDLD